MDLTRIINKTINRFLQENVEQEYRTEMKDGIVEVDNFNEIGQMIDSEKKSADDVWFVQIVKRAKDNPHEHINNRIFPKGMYYIVHDSQELMSHEREIKVYCAKNNCRAYITANKRSETSCEQYAKMYADANKKYGHHSKYRFFNGIEKEMAYGRSFPENIERDVVLIDVDTADKRVQDKVHQILDKYNVKILMEYPSLNNGLHIFTKSQEEILNVYLANEFLQFDGGKDLGQLNTVGIDFDKNALLYAALQPSGYRGATNYSQHRTAIASADSAKMRAKLQQRYNNLVSNKAEN